MTVFCPTQIKSVLLHFMRSNKRYLNTIKWRPIIGIIAILCIVLSSCAVKASIKSHLGFQQTTAQKNALNKQGNTFISSVIDCCFDTEVKALNLQLPDVKFGGTSIAILAVFTFSFLFGFSFLQKQIENPLYNSDQITGSLPIFLQHRKLII